MVEVDMDVTEGMHEGANLEVADMRNEMREECIRSDIERYAEEDISRSLIQLTAQFSIEHIKLKQRMTRRKASFCHFFNLWWIPCTDDKSSTVWITFDLLYKSGELIEAIEVSPLLAIDRSQIASFSCETFVYFDLFDKLFHFFCSFGRIFDESVGETIALKISLERSFVSDFDVILDKCSDVGLSCDEPEKFMYNGFKIYFFGREERKPLCEIHTHLIPKPASGANACSIRFIRTVIEEMLEEVEVLTHE